MSLKAFRDCPFVHPLSKYLNIARMNRKMVQYLNIARWTEETWALWGPDSFVEFCLTVSLAVIELSLFRAILFSHLNGPLISLHIFLVESIVCAQRPSPLSLALKMGVFMAVVKPIWRADFPPRFVECCSEPLGTCLGRACIGLSLKDLYPILYLIRILTSTLPPHLTSLVFFVIVFSEMWEVRSCSVSQPCGKSNYLTRDSHCLPLKASASTS